MVTLELSLVVSLERQEKDILSRSITWAVKWEWHQTLRHWQVVLDLQISIKNGSEISIYKLK